MAGGMGYRESLQSRLDIIQPSLKQVCTITGYY